MTQRHQDQILRQCREIQEIARELSPGKRHKIINRCSKIKVIINKCNKS